MAQRRMRPFSGFARWAARRSGSGLTFVLALAVVAGWLVSGPLFGFSDTWQLAINTTTTIVTFLMVFLIQNAQTRDSEAMQVKLDELIRATRLARNSVLDLEELPERELHQIQTEYEHLAEEARRRRRRRRARGRATGTLGRGAKGEQAPPPKRVA